MAADLITQVRQTIKRFHMLNKGDFVIVGVSGGPDSLTLLHLLKRLQAEYQLTLHVAHLNHQLRGEAATADAVAVTALANAWGLGVSVETVDLAALAQKKGCGLEEAGRQARYNFFGRLAKALGATRIALGHNADDQVETILMHFLRGTGPRGLGEIPPVRPEQTCILIRPLIEIERSAIEAYCLAYSLPVRIDATNQTSVFLRNRIRNELIPLLAAEYNPRLSAEIRQLGEILRTEDAYLEEISQRILRTWTAKIKRTATQLSLPLADFRKQPLALQRRLLRTALSQWRGLTGLSFTHIEAIRQISEGKPGGTFSFPGGVCRHEGTELCFYLSLPQAIYPPLHYQLPFPGSVFIPEWGLAIELCETTAQAALATYASPPAGEAIEIFAIQALQFPLCLRNRRPGDTFQPRGLGGTQSLKRWFNAAKIPSETRSQQPLLVDQAGILWVVGHRRSERAPVTLNTERVLLVRLRSCLANLDK